MYIEKQAIQYKKFRRNWFDFDRARDAFKYYLLSLNLGSGDKIIIPNYIGFSEREGSGVFDPVVESKVNYQFYELDNCLNIVVSSIERLIQEGGVALIVIIHYFGYVDPNFKSIIELAKANGVRVLEDQAHSLFTDLIGGLTGRECDASIYSLHKMLPVRKGGALSLAGEKLSVSNYTSALCLDYDLSQIASIRVKNAKFLARRLSNFTSLLSVLRPILNEGTVPQTFPVIIKFFDRDRLYQVLNNEGFGVVSLYHTMIKQISDVTYYQTNSVSKCILNLPVHQDVTEEHLDLLCDRLIQLLLDS